MSKRLKDLKKDDMELAKEIIVKNQSFNEKNVNLASYNEIIVNKNAKKPGDLAFFNRIFGNK